MATITATIEHIELCGDYTDSDGNQVIIPGVIVHCSKCGHRSEEIYGDGEDSMMAGAVRLRETCPRGQGNFYRIKN